MRRALIFLILFGAALVLYLSWLPDPGLDLPSFLPRSLRDWTNDQPNENIRTAVPFFFMGAFVTLLELKRPFDLRRHVLILLLFALLVSLAEAGQAFIPHRSPDPMDIGWGIAGSLLGMIIPLPLRLLFRSRKS